VIRRALSENVHAGQVERLLVMPAAEPQLRPTMNFFEAFQEDLSNSAGGNFEK
jgi:hypothetical protein